MNKIQSRCIRNNAIKANMFRKGKYNFVAKYVRFHGKNVQVIRKMYRFVRMHKYFENAGGPILCPANGQSQSGPEGWKRAERREWGRGNIRI